MCSNNSNKYGRPGHRHPPWRRPRLPHSLPPLRNPSPTPAHKHPFTILTTSPASTPTQPPPASHPRPRCPHSPVKASSRSVGKQRLNTLHKQRQLTIDSKRRVERFVGLAAASCCNLKRAGGLCINCDCVYQAAVAQSGHPGRGAPGGRGRPPIGGAPCGI